MFTKEELIRHYTTMVKIRKFELEAKRAREANEILGYVHLYVGEEAIATGVCACLEQKDYIESTHRGHGHTIAKGADVKNMMAELYGKATGCCKGKGGSQHIADFSVGMLGANGIVGGGFGLAVGAALASRFQGTGAVSVAFFGDGAANRGTFHESANMASAYKLPVIFVCENNGIACSTIHETSGQQSTLNIAQRAVAYNMPGDIANGNDFFSVYAAAKRLVERARNGEGCGLLECKTQRAFGHAVGDMQIYRDPEAAKANWMANDCIVNFERRCLAEGWLEQSDFDKVQAEVDELIEEAKRFAIESPDPAPEALFEDLYD